MGSVIGSNDGLYVLDGKPDPLMSPKLFYRIISPEGKFNRGVFSQYVANENHIHALFLRNMIRKNTDTKINLDISLEELTNFEIKAIANIYNAHVKKPNGDVTSPSAWAAMEVEKIDRLKRTLSVGRRKDIVDYFLERCDGVPSNLVPEVMYADKKRDAYFDANLRIKPENEYFVLIRLPNSSDA